MGSEITYKHLFGKTYQINVTLYRDCGGKKLNGQGGGTSTENSTDLNEAYIRTISTACQNKNIGNGITLSKISFENILLHLHQKKLPKYKDPTPTLLKGDPYSARG